MFVCTSLCVLVVAEYAGANRGNFAIYMSLFVNIEKLRLLDGASGSILGHVLWS